MPDEKNRQDSPLSLGGWIVIIAMLALLAGAIWYAVQVWTAMRGVAMSGWGWLFLSLGIAVTTLVGVGLMALVFYSARHDMDR